MGLWDKLTGEFVDVIEWTDDSQDVMVYRFNRHGNEIKYGAMLTVRESQTAVFVNEGQIADVFPPGLYQLETANLPILTTLQSWPHGFKSPFKAEVYFLNTRQFTDLKWGTKNPVMMRDQEFGPVRLRAFGTYAIRISEPSRFLLEVAGTNAYFETDEITEQLRNVIVSRFSSLLGESGIPILDLAGNYDDLSEFLSTQVSPEFKEYGLGLTKLMVENISLPKSVEEALDRRTSMGMVGNLRDYMTFQTAEALRAGAENPSGEASAGIGMGMGFAMAQKLGESLSAPTPVATSGGQPPPIPAASELFLAVDGEQSGPFASADLPGLVSSGTLQAGTLVWRAGMDQWQPASSVADLQSILRTTPPPIPKS